MINGVYIGTEVNEMFKELYKRKPTLTEWLEKTVDIRKSESVMINATYLINKIKAGEFSGL